MGRRLTTERSPLEYRPGLGNQTGPLRTGYSMPGECAEDQDVARLVANSAPLNGDSPAASPAVRCHISTLHSTAMALCAVLFVGLAATFAFRPERLDPSMSRIQTHQLEIQ